MAPDVSLVVHAQVEMSEVAGDEGKGHPSSFLVREIEPLGQLHRCELQVAVDPLANCCCLQGIRQVLNRVRVQAVYVLRAYK